MYNSSQPRTSCPITGEPQCKCNPKTNIASLYPRPFDALRKLFTDHAVYTSKYISSYLNLDTESLVKRLLANQVEIGTFMGQYIGVGNGKAVADLLTEHIKRAAKVVITLFSDKDTTQSVADLFANSDDVAAALCHLPGNKLDCERVKREFHQHNQLVIDLAMAHYKGEHEKEVPIYDAYYTHMLSFSDMLYAGLIHGRPNVI
jgi:hypothetical protein